MLTVTRQDVLSYMNKQPIVEMANFDMQQHEVFSIIRFGTELQVSTVNMPVSWDDKKSLINIEFKHYVQHSADYLTLIPLLHLLITHI
jgi:hypothetical protein